MKFALIAFIAIDAALALTIVGGWTDQDPGNVEFFDLAGFAGQHISNARNHPNHAKVARLLGVRTQVVGGMNYELDIELVPTDCPKKTVKYEACPAASPTKYVSLALLLLN